MTPVICFITDRRRLGSDWEASLVERVGAAARAGVHLIQIRERDLDARRLVGLVERSVAAIRGTRARVIVNDRIDVAIAAGAHGVHLRGDSIDAGRARRLVPPGFLLGRSVHGVDEARLVGSSGTVDYLVFGHVFETTSKPGLAAAGVAALAAVAAATTIPVLAVGGVSTERARDVGEAGAAGVAAIELFARPVIADLPRVVMALGRRFDTREAVT